MSVLDIDTFLATQALSEAAQSEPDITRELEAGDSLPSSSPSPHGTPPPAQAQRLAAEDTFSTISTVTAHSRGVSVVSSSAGSTGRKRAGEDLSMLVQRTARKAKLKADGELTLSKFTKVFLLLIHRYHTVISFHSAHTGASGTHYYGKPHPYARETRRNSAERGGMEAAC